MIKAMIASSFRSSQLRNAGRENFIRLRKLVNRFAVREVGGSV